MKIGQLACVTGVTASAIRYYERLGLLPTPDRASGQRRYPRDAHNRVLLIRFASEMGFTLGEIKMFLSGLQNASPVGPRWKRLANRKIKEVDDSIKRARRLKSLLEHLIQCRCPSLQVCVQRLSLSPNLQTIRRSKLPPGRAKRNSVASQMVRTFQPSKGFGVPQFGPPSFPLPETFASST